MAINSCGVQPDGIILEAVFDETLNTVRHRFEAIRKSVKWFLQRTEVIR